MKFILKLALSTTFLLPAYTLTAQRHLKTIIVDAGHGGTDVGAVGQYENSLRSREKDITLAISNKLVQTLKKAMPDVNVVPTRTTDVYQSVKEKAAIANQNKGDLFLCIHADAANLKTGKREIGQKTVTKYKVKKVGKGKKAKTIREPYEVQVPIYEYYKIPTARSGTSVWIFAAHKTSDKIKAIMNDEEIQFESAEDSSIAPLDFQTPVGRQIAQIYAKKYQEKSDRIAQLVNDEVEKTGRNALGVSQRQVGIWVLQATNMPAILIETGFISNPDDERYLNSEKGQQELADAITKAVLKYRDITESKHIAEASK